MMGLSNGVNGITPKKRIPQNTDECKRKEKIMKVFGKFFEYKRDLAL